jgi:hypothetical protein
MPRIKRRLRGTLMAFAAASLWERRDRTQGLLTRNSYEAIGGVAGALAQHAEATLEKIGTDKLPLVRELFRNLVTAEGTRAVRDVDEMHNAGFKALARRLCVGHAFSHPVRWNCQVEVFGRTVLPGDLIHADQHGFLVIPPQDQAQLLAAADFMDANECATFLAAARGGAGRSTEEILAALDAAAAEFAKAAL